MIAVAPHDRAFVRLLNVCAVLINVVNIFATEDELSAIFSVFDILAVEAEFGVFTIFQIVAERVVSVYVVKLFEAVIGGKFLELVLAVLIISIRTEIELGNPFFVVFLFELAIFKTIFFVP